MASHVDIVEPFASPASPVSAMRGRALLMVWRRCALIAPAIPTSKRPQRRLAPPSPQPLRPPSRKPRPRCASRCAPGPWRIRQRAGSRCGPLFGLLVLRVHMRGHRVELVGKLCRFGPVQPSPGLQTAEIAGREPANVRSGFFGCEFPAGGASTGCRGWCRIHAVQSITPPANGQQEMLQPSGKFAYHARQNGGKYMRNHWSTLLALWLGNESKDPARPKAYKLAKSAGMTPATLSRYLSGDIGRPTESALQALTAAIMRVDPPAAVSLVVEHLRDEIERCGLLPDAVAVKASGVSVAARCTPTCERLSMHARHRPDVAELLESLLVVLDAALVGETRAPAMVAEPRAPYGGKARP